MKDKIIKEMNMKFYYNEKTGKIRNHCFYDEDTEGESLKMPSIELTIDEWSKTLASHRVGKAYFYKNDELVLDDDPDIINTEEYKAEVKANEIATLKQYLSDTDYVISKLNELKLEDEAEYEAEKIKYADILKKRKEARVKINELQGN